MPDNLNVPPVGPLDSESVKLSPHNLEQIAHNLCSLHGFDPAFVVTQEAFARAVIREYVRLSSQAGEGAASEAGPAETEIGRAVYERIETLLKTDPRGAELEYLSHLAESVEEVGGYDGPLAPFAETWTPPTDPRLDRLKLAICGGEDVPGAIAAVTVEDCERFLVEERQRHEWSDTQQARLDRAIEALEKARAALHQHYVDWDGEPEDAVPLQLARSECDQALASIRGEA